ncbi:MAG: flagellar basal body-associated FliL family protein [Pirellulales bacterium]|nr:flagellar basal body-associated FliL family protein [Pirellulales bacterium]
MPRRRERTAWPRSAGVAGALALVMCGCGSSKQELRLLDYLEELEFDVPLESATYVSLGKFDIPLVADKTEHHEMQRAHDSSRSHLWMRVQFELTAETAPQWKEAIATTAQRRQGALSDAVLTVVRSSPVSDLSDPRLSAINARLADVVRPILGEDRVRRLMFNKLEQPAVEVAAHGAEGSAAEHGGHEDQHAGHQEHAHGGSH